MYLLFGVCVWLVWLVLRWFVAWVIVCCLVLFVFAFAIAYWLDWLVNWLLLIGAFDGCLCIGCRFVFDFGLLLLINSVVVVFIF